MMITLDPSLDDLPITVCARTATLIAEVLEHAETFLRQASDATRADMRTYLHEHTGADAGWLIDMAGFHALFLQAKLALAAEAAAKGTTGQEASS